MVRKIGSLMLLGYRQQGGHAYCSPKEDIT
jgi:hypothetical protein